MDRDRVLIDLALQGGGSHGAFTRGVLDRLLEENWLHITAISGTSAAPMLVQWSLLDPLNGIVAGNCAKRERP